MTAINLSLLPVGRSTFSTLRKAGQIYADKTEMICDLAVTRGKYFLVRPRRFGKSLLVSTFASLFRYGLRDFRGLAIEKKWTDTTYPVAHLDFSEIRKFSDVQHFRNKLGDYIKTSFSPLGFAPDSEQDTFSQFSAWLQSLPGDSIVILIDEYDAPLTACIDNPEVFTGIQGVFSKFFSALKARESCIRFAFMTGITKYSNTGIFSEFNNFTDISLSVQYGTLLGLTEKELRRYFGDFIQNAGERLGMSPETVLTELRDHYGGFSFDARAASHVCCPWSVLTFLQLPEDGFVSYWYASGGQPALLTKYLSTHRQCVPEIYERDPELSLTGLSVPIASSPESFNQLLLQTGYLTIKESLSCGLVRAGYPNREVAVSLAQLCMRLLISEEEIRASGISRLGKVLSGGSLEAAVAQINQAFVRIPYGRYPVTSEAACRALLLMLLTGAESKVLQEPRAEVQNAQGRSDLEFLAGSRYWVLELKFARTAKEVPALLDQAAEQIRLRRYGETDHGGRALLRAACVFSAEERRFTAFREVPLS